MARYDPDRLDRLGERRAQLRAELAAISAQIEAEIARALRAGLVQAEIVRRLRMTRESVVQLSRPAEQRWRRGKKLET